MAKQKVTSYEVILKWICMMYANTIFTLSVKMNKKVHFTYRSKIVTYKCVSIRTLEVSSINKLKNNFNIYLCLLALSKIYIYCV